MTQETPPRPDDLALIRVALAAEDVNWGYDHGFSTVADEETDAFARTVLGALDLPARDARVRAETLREAAIRLPAYSRKTVAVRARLNEMADEFEHPVRPAVRPVDATADLPEGSGHPRVVAGGPVPFTGEQLRAAGIPAGAVVTADAVNRVRPILTGPPDDDRLCICGVPWACRCYPTPTDPGANRDH